jgi:hypothetical protein
LTTIDNVARLSVVSLPEAFTERLQKGGYSSRHMKELIMCPSKSVVDSLGVAVYPPIKGREFDEGAKE